MRPWLYWCFIVPLYWATVVHVLRSACPVSNDGFGPTATFYWGKHPPAPDPAEYYGNRAHFDWVFNIQYYVAGLIITVLGCGIGPQIGKRLTRRPWRRFAITLAATLTLLLVAAIVSDAGGRLGWWPSPRILMRTIDGYQEMSVLLKVFLLPSILSGAVGLCRDLVTKN